MTPSEFKKIRQGLSLTMRELSAILRCDERTMRRWEALAMVASSRPIPHHVAMIMALLRDKKITVKQLIKLQS